MTIIEICVDDIAGVVAAAAGGADRVEFCRDLRCGGLTPTEGDLGAAVAAAPPGGLHVLVRPRPGSAHFTRDEVRDMYWTIRRLRDHTRGAPVPVGFAVGALNADGTIDEVAAAAFRQAAGNRPLTFSRAFDGTPDLFASLRVLRGLGYQRVVTTGGHPVRAQPQALAELVRASHGFPSVAASGGIRLATVDAILDATHAPEIHLRAPGPSGWGTDRAVVAAVIDRVRDVDRLTRRGSGGQDSGRVSSGGPATVGAGEV